MFIQSSPGLTQEYLGPSSADPIVLHRQDYQSICMRPTVPRETSKTPTHISLTDGLVILVLRLIKEMCIIPSHLVTATVLVKGKPTLIFLEGTSHNLFGTITASVLWSNAWCLHG